VAVIVGDLIELSSGSLTIGIVPRIGGSLAYFRMDGMDLLRPLSSEDRQAGNVLGTAMFPMLPYANRIAGNSFDFGGQTWTFSPNHTLDRHTLHGSGWKSAWQATQLDDGVLLSLDHLAPDEPYCYSATQLFTLTEAGLAVELGLTNRGAHAMPFGFGLHPWFERQPEVQLSFNASHFLLEGPEGIPTDWLALPPELDFAGGKRLPDRWRNNDYSGWDGSADLGFLQSGWNMTISADPVFGHLMLYADPEKSFFCLEPQSHAPCAFNRLADPQASLFGGHILESGERLAGTIRFEPSWRGDR
jgi:aldose 1-epimerase